MSADATFTQYSEVMSLLDQVLDQVDQIDKRKLSPAHLGDIQTYLNMLQQRITALGGRE